VALDGMGRVTSVSNALNQTTSVLYDAVGNRTRLTDALNRQTNYAYDALDRLTSVTDATSPAGVTSYGYDANGNLTSVINALGKVWSYAYDKRNRLLTATDPLNNQSSYTYDANSNVTHVLKPDGTTNRFVYDRANRLTGMDFANNSTLDIQYAYDNASRRTTITDGTGTTTYVYDNADRLTSQTAPVTGTVSYGYDAAGRRTSITHPTTSHQVSYGYNNRGELASVQAWTVGTTTYSHDAAGRLTGIATPNGVNSTLAYDLADRLTRIAHVQGMTTLEDIQYVVNAVGNRTSMTDSAGTTTWTYDNLDRLTNVSYPNGDTVAYGYDKVGNRTSHTMNGSPKTNAFDDANRLTASGTDTYTYDANGNQTSKTSGGVTTTFSYDALDRLVGVSGPVTASYSYNGDGLRVSKTIGGNTTPFSWGAIDLPRVISDGTEYVWGAGLIGQVTGGGTPTYAHADGLGSIRLLTDAMGTVVGTRQYDAFGAARSTSGTTLPFGYTGEQEDAESGLVYLRARYLDPATGRFLSRDPYPGQMPDPAGQHGYTYAHNQPTVWTDPSGESPVQGNWAGACGAQPGSMHLAAASPGGGGRPPEPGKDCPPGFATHPQAGEPGFPLVPCGKAPAGAGYGGSCPICAAVLGAAGIWPEPPRLDASGRIHTPRLPGYVPRNWTRQQLEQLQMDLETSIASREANMRRWGEEGGHRDRLEKERRLLEQVRRRLRDMGQR
jgi:RHS repeat-associated protein